MSRFNEQISQFFSANAPESSTLVLDSTGPSVTKHYLVLSEIGHERLLRFKEVYGFSGGTFAYLGFLAVSEHKLAKPIHAYFETFERDFRRAHHSDTFSIVRGLLNFARRKTFGFGDASIQKTLELIFSQEFLQTPLSALHPQFKPYVTCNRTHTLVNARQVESMRTVNDLLLESTRVPFFYGVEASHHFYDAAFSPHYRKKLREFSDYPAQVLVSTPWRSGSRGSAVYVKCVEARDAKTAMFSDFIRIALNLPNKSFNRDLRKAFGKEFRVSSC